jgi:hypothetical protein
LFVSVVLQKGESAEDLLVLFESAEVTHFGIKKSFGASIGGEGRGVITGVLLTHRRRRKNLETKL